MIITDEVINFYFFCKLKSQYLYSEKKPTNHSFQYHYKLYEKNAQKNFLYKTPLLKDYIYSDFNLKIIYPFIEINESIALPIYMSFKAKISNEFQMACSFKSKLLSNHLDKTIKHYKVALHDGSVKKFRVQETIDIDHLKDELQNDQKICKSKHCNMCEYASLCNKILLDRNDLRLLGSMSETEVEKWNNKGYFSINQLSYYYKPRKQSLVTSTRSRYKYELKALALRESKVYFTGDISIDFSKTEIYIDFETLPDERYVYLISAVIVHQGKLTKLWSFWADTINQEEEIFQKLFDILKQHRDYRIYHYGNFEIKELNKFNSKNGEKYSDEVESILEHSYNLLEYFYEDVFVPTYTNGLKDICKYFGFSWSRSNVTGALSIVWRKQWEEALSNKIKKKLIAYNIEDCIALFKLKQWMIDLQDNKVNSINLYDLFGRSGYKFGENKFEIDTFNDINKTAYFDYQRSKIYIKDRSFQKSINTKGYYCSKKIKHSKPNKIVISQPPSFCEKCQNKKFYKHEKYIRIITDIKFTKDGIKKHLIEYQHFRYRCSKCKIIYAKNDFSKSKYGDNLARWILYTHMSYQLSFGNISKMLNVFFNIDINRVYVLNTKKRFKIALNHEYEKYINHIVAGNIIHIDETTVIINKRKHYVWVMTNLTHVVYIFRENRTTDFLKSLLDDFKGVLISDFYTGYDALEVKHQKCLIHFMRDINDLIFKNQDNHELIFIGKQFGELLNKIIKTIDRFGLKKYHLNKHKKDVIRFYKALNHFEYKSQIAQKLKKRFLKNRDLLFTFLSYDSVPWNNNNVEHAIKEFAKYRRNTDGLYSKNSLQEYLILLSVYQTCKYQNIDFLEYLKKTNLSNVTYTE